jgi:hypothetical protein
VLPLANVLYLLADELAGLRTRGLALPARTPRSLERLSFGHSVVLPRAFGGARAAAGLSHPMIVLPGAARPLAPLISCRRMFCATVDATVRTAPAAAPGSFDPTRLNDLHQKGTDCHQAIAANRPSRCNTDVVRITASDPRGPRIRPLDLACAMRASGRDGIQAPWSDARRSPGGRGSLAAESSGRPPPPPGGRVPPSAEAACLSTWPE